MGAIVGPSSLAAPITLPARSDTLVHPTIMKEEWCET